MSSLTYIEKAKLEKLLGMATGYVSNFSNSSFGLFMAETAGVDIHAEKYSINTSGSKANKLRGFWESESDYIVGKALKALIQYVEEGTHDASQATLINSCKIYHNRLLSGKVNLTDLKEKAAKFDAAYLTEQIHRIEQSIESDPALAIGTAKELIETCCKTILTERNIKISGNADISNLTKDTLKALKLVPDEIPEAARGADVIKRLLQNLGTIGNGLAELRGLYGTGHGKHSQAKGLSSRHAKLAVGAASTLATFLFDTHKEVS